MSERRLDRRWLAATVAAMCMCGVSVGLATSVAGDAAAKEIFNALAWLAAIAVAFCGVRSGIDAGVHHR